MDASQTTTCIRIPHSDAPEVVVLCKQDGVTRRLVRDVDYVIEDRRIAITFKNEIVINATISITTVWDKTTRGNGRSYMLPQKSKQPNYRDILPKRARRW